MSILGVSSLGKFIMIFASVIIIFVLYLFLLSINKKKKKKKYRIYVRKERKN